MSEGAQWVHDMYNNVTEEDLAAGRKALLSGSVGAGVPKIYSKGRGAKYWTQDGQEFIDCTSQAWSLGVGACHPKVMDAVKAQLEYFTHVRTNFDTLPRIMLSKRLIEIAPGDIDNVTYCLHGTTAVEGALKLAIRNKPNRKYFITLWDGYAGRTLATMDLTYPHPTPFLHYTGHKIRLPQAYCYRCYYEKTYPECDLYCVKMMDKFIENAVDGKPIGLLMEPIQASGGMIPFPEPYYKAIRDLCDRHDMLLIWDEIQTGFGRVGEMFCSELYETLPDITIFGKALGGGFPIAGSMQRKHLRGFESGDHSFTFAHFPVSFVASLATLRVIEEEDHLENCRKMGAYFTEKLKELQKKYEIMGDIRGPGLMLGIELVRDRKTKEKACEETTRFVQEGFKRGVQFGHSKYGGMGNVVKIKPPLVINEEEADKVMQVFEEVTELLSSGKGS
jgi:4-aminobutyrate aminotransferase/4-aminobutyrate aminotransferase/(S)-3-amino-2-methylpropionate transaminase